MSTPALSVGQKVELNDGRIGTIRYLGSTSFAAGEWVGVELEEATGKNDGSVQAKRYFECAAAHGIFCRDSGIKDVLPEPKPKAKPTGNGAPVKGRPSSIQGTLNGTRRQTLQQDAPGRRVSTLQNSPTPAGRVPSGIRSPVKSPTKQLGTNGTSSASTSRTGTPPVTGKKPVAAGAAKLSRASMLPPSTVGAAAGRRTSTLPSAGATRAARQAPPSTTTSRSSAMSKTSAVSRAAPSTRPGLQERLRAAKEESTGDEASERSSVLSPRESAASEVASQDEAESEMDERDDTITNFAPPPVPPVPQEPPPPLSRSRRTSSPGASIHSQRTLRSGAASNREIEELQTKVRLLERKRTEDRELKQSLEKAERERDQYKGIIEKLQDKYRPWGAEIEKLKKELAEYQKRVEDVDEMQARHEVELEAALVDREFAEEQAESFKENLETLRSKNEEYELELDILRQEKEGYSTATTPEDRASVGWLQLERTNDRLREALLSLRDMTQDKEAELKEEIDALEEQVKDMESMKGQFEGTKEQLLRSQSQCEELQQRLEAAEVADEMIENLGEENENLRLKMNELRGAIEDLEALKELNDELEINHVEAEKQMQEELDFKDSLLLDRERTAREQQQQLDQADYNINRFRELVTQLQSDLQDLEASKQISESEAAQLSSKSRAMMDLNHKLQSSAAKTQVKTIDLELRKLDAEQASEHLAIIQLFLPDSFEAERDSVLSLLRFKRIGFKANLIQSFVKERIASFGTRAQDEAVFAACDALDKLTWITGVADQLVNSISSCSANTFAQYGGALYELEVVERTMNDYVDALRRDDLNEADMPVRLGRSIEVMTHLSSLHLHNGLADHADDLINRALLLQSRLDSATTAFTLTKTMIQKHLPIPSDEDDEDDDGSTSDTALIVNRLKSIIEQTRNAKVVSGKTHRALSDLQVSHMTLDQRFVEYFEKVESVVSQIATYACQCGSSLQETFFEEGRNEPFTPSEVAAVLSRVATSLFSLPSAEAGPYATLATKLRDLSSLLTDLSALPTDIDNTVEFERAPAPWVARAEELKQTKITSGEVEAELTRTLESVRERDSALRQKETELEEQSVRIEMLEARMKDASKRSAKIAELERSLREAKENEAKAKGELKNARQESQRDLDRVRDEMGRLAEARKTSGRSRELDGDAMGASVRITIKRQEYKIAGLEGAVRYLKEDNHRLRLPAATAPVATQSSIGWLKDPLQKPQKASKVLQREGSKALEQLLVLASQPPSIDLTKMPENKLAWRPAKESSRWQIEHRNEEWADWKQWREELISRATMSMPRGGRVATNGVAA
ncbi:Dynactin, isoform [Fulvia fulva]|nr:Dynactin, isoform [Fulvia fulva]